MKNRDYKKFAPGAVIHIFNRGNNKEKIFFDKQDYKAFLFRLGLGLGFEEKELQKDNLLSLPHSRIRVTSISKKDFKLHCFCLMPNHFHLLIEQVGDTPVSTLISKVCTSYAMYLNKKYKRVGHVFQDRFKSVLVENDPQLMWLSAYIHTNPVKEKLTRYPKEYIWSSYNDYVSKRNLLITNTTHLSDIFGTKDFEKETFNLAQEV